MEHGPGGLNQAVQLRQMMLDMGYAEDAARSALQRCGSVDEAIDLIASEDAQDPRVVAPHGIGMAWPWRTSPSIVVQKVNQQ